MQKMAPLRNCPKEPTLHEQWLKMWTEFELEFDDLPDWSQKVLLQDINTAFKNRIAVLKEAANQPVGLGQMGKCAAKN